MARAYAQCNQLHLDKFVHQIDYLRYLSALQCFYSLMQPRQWSHLRLFSTLIYMVVFPFLTFSTSLQFPHFLSNSISNIKPSEGVHCFLDSVSRWEGACWLWVFRDTEERILRTLRFLTDDISLPHLTLLTAMLSSTVCCLSFPCWV